MIERICQFFGNKHAIERSITGGIINFTNRTKRYRSWFQSHIKKIRFSSGVTWWSTISITSLRLIMFIGSTWWCHTCSCVGIFIVPCGPLSWPTLSQSSMQSMRSFAIYVMYEMVCLWQPSRPTNLILSFDANKYYWNVINLFKDLTVIANFWAVVGKVVQSMIPISTVSVNDTVNEGLRLKQQPINSE